MKQLNQKEVMSVYGAEGCLCGHSIITDVQHFTDSCKNYCCEIPGAYEYCPFDPETITYGQLSNVSCYPCSSLEDMQAIDALVFIRGTSS